MLSRVIAKNVGDVFLRHSVDVIELICTEIDLSGCLNQSVASV